MKRVKLALSVVGLMCGIVAGAQQYSNQTEAWDVDVSTNGIWGAGVATVDFDLDGDVDLTTLGDGQPPKMLRNDGDHFTDVTPALVSEHTEMITFPDVDNDGDLDIFITQNGAPNRLYLNTDGVYTDHTSSAGLPVQDDPTYGHSWGDINNDGWLDLYVCNYWTNGVLEVENYLFLNDGAGNFSNITASAGVGDGLKSTFLSLFLDYDRDGDQDLVVMNDRDPFENQLYRNEGDLTFSTQTFPSNMGDYIWSMSGAVGDLNNNGWFDIYICNNADGNLVKRYNPDTEQFNDVAPELGITVNEFCWGAQFLDYNNNGWSDLYVQSQVFPFWNSYGHNHLFTSNAGIFSEELDEEFPALETNSFTSGVADFNGDGKLDIFSHALEPEGSSLWINEADAGNYLAVNLHGVESNSMGIGSFIEAWYQGGEYQMQYVLCGEAYLSQNPYTEHFGLGEASKVDSLKVTWLSGVTDWFYSIPINQTIDITEGESFIELMVEGNQPICPGQSVSVTAPGYDTIFWSNGDVGASTEISSTMTVSGSALNDFGALVNTESIDITEAAQGEWTVEIVSPVCWPDTLGTLTVNGPDADLVSPAPDWTADPNALSLTETTWFVIDDQGCTYSGPIAFEIPDEIFLTTSITHPTCFGGSDGFIEASATGGNPPFVVNWPNGNEGLSAGTYPVSVTDSMGCVLTDNLTLDNPPVIEAYFVASYLLCSNDSNGVIVPWGTGGTGPLEFILPENNGELTEGDYSVLVIDSLNCQMEYTVSFEAPDPIVLDIDQSNIDSTGNGTLLITATGGTGDIEVWVNGVACPSPCEVSPGEYEIVATDENDCSVSETLTITLVSETASFPQPILVPNPTSGMGRITGLQGFSAVRVFSITGALIWSAETNQTELELPSRDWAPGSYSIQVVTRGDLAQLMLIKT